MYAPQGQQNDNPNLDACLLRSSIIARVSVYLVTRASRHTQSLPELLHHQTAPAGEELHSLLSDPNAFCSAQRSLRGCRMLCVDTSDHMKRTVCMQERMS